MKPCSGINWLVVALAGAIGGCAHFDPQTQAADATASQPAAAIAAGSGTGAPAAPVQASAASGAPISPATAGVAGAAAPTAVTPGAESALRVEPSLRMSSPVRAAASPYDEGRAAILAGRYDQAIEHLRTALAANPRDVDALNGLGVALDLQGRTAEALRAFERAVELAPQHAHLHANLGIALAKAKRPADADAAFRRAFRLDPKNQVVRDHLRKLAQQLYVGRGGAWTSAAEPSSHLIVTGSAAGATLVQSGPNVYDLQFPAQGVASGPQ
ncbi:MAG TPA: tetratricopeptide repeat protein [Burkholderiaceae bacterium]|nr:tetratricopeptide repeat protein [Burkholderiaceae bacterium]